MKNNHGMEMKSSNDLESSIREFDSKYPKEKSVNIFIIDDITAEHLSEHNKRYLSLDNDEKPLLLLNGKKGLMAKLMPFSGFVLTNKKIHFSLLKRSFLTGLYPFREKPRNLKIESVDSFQIGEHDACFGTAYTGHDLRINDEALGLVRLGFSIEYDDKALSYINKLSGSLFDSGLLRNSPKEFSWQ